MNFSALKFGKLRFNLERGKSVWGYYWDIVGDSLDLEGGKSEDQGATYNHSRAAAAPNTRNLWVFDFFFVCLAQTSCIFQIFSSVAELQTLFALYMVFSLFAYSRLSCLNFYAHIVFSKMPNQHFRALLHFKLHLLSLTKIFYFYFFKNNNNFNIYVTWLWPRQIWANARRT
jgi:hypothetical protein